MVTSMKDHHDVHGKEVEDQDTRNATNGSSYGTISSTKNLPSTLPSPFLLLREDELLHAYFNTCFDNESVNGNKPEAELLLTPALPLDNWTWNPPAPPRALFHFVTPPRPPPPPLARMTMLLSPSLLGVKNLVLPPSGVILQTSMMMGSCCTNQTLIGSSPSAPCSTVLLLDTPPAPRPPVRPASSSSWRSHPITPPMVYPMYATTPGHLHPDPPPPPDETLAAATATTAATTTAAAAAATAAASPRRGNHRSNTTKKSPRRADRRQKAQQEEVARKKERVDAWMKTFELAKQYKEDHGHCWIPQKQSQDEAMVAASQQTSDHHHDQKDDPDNDDDDERLRLWARAQRNSYSNLMKKRFSSGDGSSTGESSSTNHHGETKDDENDALLNAERVALLDSIGFIWEFHCTQWWRQYNELVEFKWQTGHTRVPAVHRGDRGNRALGSWVRTQRRNFALRKLSPERLVALNQIGFEFHVKPGRKRSIEHDERVGVRITNMTQSMVVRGGFVGDGTSTPRTRT